MIGVAALVSTEIFCLFGCIKAEAIPRCLVIMKMKSQDEGGDRVVKEIRVCSFILGVVVESARNEIIAPMRACNGCVLNGEV